VKKLSMAFGLGGDEGGAIIVEVALAMIALLAFSTLVADYGVLWASRRQAQNSADAAALAGAIALLYDNPTDFTSTGPAKQSAFLASQQNLIWGQPPSVQPTTDITFVTCPDGSANCVRVNVYRNSARGNALPMFFGYFVGLTSQGIQATATADLGSANATNCMMPWAVPDQFIDTNGNGVFDPGIDTYTAPSPSSPGTGYTATLPPTGSYGTELQLKGASPPQLGPGWFQALDINPPGANGYRAAIEGCVNTEYGIGDIAPPKNGNMSGPTLQGVTALIAKDPGASWDSTTQRILGSCAQANPSTCPAYNQSPRIVAVPVFDPYVFATTGQIKITNFFGFFVERDGGNGNQSNVWGILINVPAGSAGTERTRSRSRIRPRLIPSRRPVTLELVENVFHVAALQQQLLDALDTVCVSLRIEFGLVGGGGQLLEKSVCLQMVSPDHIWSREHKNKIVVAHALAESFPLCSRLTTSEIRWCLSGADIVRSRKEEKTKDIAIVPELITPR
jgi:Flp pilus assembly protein TadG